MPPPCVEHWSSDQTAVRLFDLCSTHGGGTGLPHADRPKHETPGAKEEANEAAGQRQGTGATPRAELRRRGEPPGHKSAAGDPQPDRSPAQASGRGANRRPVFEARSGGLGP